jgi:hypothetical protein
MQLTRRGGVGPLGSPDGKFLYYAKALDATSAWRVPVEGGEEIQVLESLSSYDNMAVVHEGIYFIPTQGPAKASSPQLLSFVSGQIKPIFTLEKPAGDGLTVSPDGRWMLYTQIDQQWGGDLILVENFR